MQIDEVGTNQVNNTVDDVNNEPQQDNPPDVPVNNLITNNGDRTWGLMFDGDQRRDELFANYAGLTAGAVTAQQPWIADAQGQRIYQQAYGAALQEFQDFHATQIQPLAESLAVAAGKTPADAPRFYADAVTSLRTNPAFANTPMSMTEVVNKAGATYRTEISRFNFGTGDIPRQNPFRASDFLVDYAGDGTAPMTRVDPNVLMDRINNNVSSGDYLLRMTGEPYMSTPDAVLSPSPRAWSAPFDEVAGYRLNSSEIFGAFGLSSSTSPDSQRIAVINSADFPVVPATWETMIQTAQTRGATTPTSQLAPFASNGTAFWQSVQTLDYQNALTDMQTRGMNPTSYAAFLDTTTPGSGDVFLARNGMDTELGVNKWFRGDGIVIYNDGTPGSREFGVGDSQIRLADRMPNGQYPELAFVDVNSTGSSGVTSPTATPVNDGVYVPNAPNTIRTEVRNGAIMGGGVSLLTSSYQAYNDVINGRQNVGDALLNVGANTALGTTVGAGSAALENYATRTITSMSGGAARTAFGQMTRQALGAGAAGGIVNAGFAAFNNYEALQNGDMTGAQYTGQIVGEAAVGLAAGVSGAYAGAVIGSFIPVPVVGTVVGAAVGFVVGMGVDYLSRELGLNTAIANFTEGAIDTVGQALDTASTAVSNFVSDTTASISNALDDAGDAVGNFFSGAADTLSSIFG